MLERYKELKDLIEKYSYYYYEKNESLISDKEFDLLLKELEQIEKEYPQFKNEYSPSQKAVSYTHLTLPTTERV